MIEGARHLRTYTKMAVARRGVDQLVFTGKAPMMGGVKEGYSYWLPAQQNSEL